LEQNIIFNCIEDGGWKFIFEGSCNCSTATKERVRSCIDPPTLGQGVPCEKRNGQSTTGNETIYDDCTAECNRNGSWSDWVNGTCDPCGANITGYRNQTRYCNNPTPLGNGTNCTDSDNNEAVMETRVNVTCSDCPGISFFYYI